MASGEENFPVPKINREVKVLPAITMLLCSNDILRNVKHRPPFVEKASSPAALGRDRQFPGEPVLPQRFKEHKRRAVGEVQ